MPGARARQVPVPHRPHHAGARPRARRARVARQRQADQGVARRRHPAGRRALLLLRRLGRQARARRLRRRPAAARRRRPGHPVELPAADAGVEDRARAGLRQHRRAQARRDHAADRAAVRRDLPAGRPAAGRRQHRHRRRRRPGSALVEHPDVDKVAFTGSTDVGRAIAKAVAGTDKKVTLELGGKAANIVFDDAPIDQAVEGIVNGIFFNQGHVCCAGSRLLVQESVARRGASTGSSAGWRRCASATRSTRTPTSARSTPPSSSPGSASCPTSARPRAPSAGRRRASCPTTASGSRRRSSPASRRRTGSPARRSSARCCRC